MGTRIRSLKHPVQSGAAQGLLVSVIAGLIVVAVIAAAVFLLYTRPAPEPPVAPEPPAAPEEPPLAPAVPPPPVSKEARPETAREVIAELNDADSPAAYAKAHSQAREFHDAGRLADAQLLYFFAARGGHAAAAFDLATMYDPTHYTPASSLMDEPDPFQAYKWYAQAREAGHQQAGQRLAQLRAWAEDAADAGDADAERLLLTWE